MTTYPNCCARINESLDTLCICKYVCMEVCIGERQKERDRDRDRDRETERQTERDRDRQRQRERETGIHFSKEEEGSGNGGDAGKQPYYAGQHFHCSKCQ